MKLACVSLVLLAGVLGLVEGAAHGQAPPPPPALAPSQPAAVQPSPAPAQPAMSADLGSVQAIEDAYVEARVLLEKKRFQALAELAARQEPADASVTYEMVFQHAIEGDLYVVAEPVAEQALAKANTLSDYARFLAVAVDVIGKVERGAYDESLVSLRKAAARRNQQEQAAVDELPVPVRVSLIEFYLQRLIENDQYDIARQALELLQNETTDDAIKQYLASRLKRLALVGKPAPPIQGTDLEGKPLTVAEFKGKVVFVTFWASWCLPSAEVIDDFLKLAGQYEAQGFEVIGINLDTLQEGGTELETVMPNIKRFLLDYNVSFRNLVNGPGDQDFATAYGITDLPSNVLIGRDGTIVHFDLTVENLDREVAEALGR